MVRPICALLLAWTAGCAGIAEEPCSSPGVTESCTQLDGNVGSRTCGSGPGHVGETWSVCEPASCTGAVMSCNIADSRTAGVAACANGYSASPCGVASVCMPGDTRQDDPSMCVYDACTLSNGSWGWQSQETTPCDTPLVLALEDEHVVFTSASGEFDLSGSRASFATKWVSPRTPWLAIDLDGNGRIDDGRELFGSMTELPDGSRAANGFVALANLDDDRDGQITARDAAFAQLLLWRDADQDRVSSPDELMPASAAGLVAIRLGYQVAIRCDDGDCEVERAGFVFRDASGRDREGSVIDVHLARR